MDKEYNIPSYLKDTALPNLVEKLTNSSNIKISNNKYGSKVDTVVNKIVEKADDITKAIDQELVNDSHSFKVGTGQVDVSSNVEDGFGEVGIKGITYQNIAKNTQQTTITYGKNIQDNIHLLKPKTVYTIIFDLIENNLIDDSRFVIELDGHDGASKIAIVASDKVGRYIKTATTRDVVAFTLWVSRVLGSNVIIKNLTVIEGDHTNNPNLPSSFEGVVGVGDKSKNLFNGKLELGTINATTGADAISSNSYRSIDYIKIPSNKTITVSRTIFNNANPLRCYDKNKNFIESSLTLPSGTSTKTFVLPSNVEYIRFVDFTNNKNNTIQIEEGSIATEHQPYGTHKIEILSNGKNLYKPNLQTESENGLTFTLLSDNQLLVNGTCTKTTDFRPVSGLQTPYLSDFVNNKLQEGTILTLSNNLGLTNYFSLKRNNQQLYPVNKLTIQSGDTNIACFVRFENGQSYNNAKLNIQLEINDVATEFEPYKEDKTQILLDEPLIRLPNGVADEITRDGKLIRRVDKIILDGSEDEQYGTENNSHNTIYFHYAGIGKITSKSLLCDTFVTHSGSIYTQDIEGMYIAVGVKFKILKSKLQTQDVDGFKKWLQANPTTVYYELETPIITDIIPPSLRIFKDGHLTFNTLVAPESTHKVQLNKSAQIEQTVKEVYDLNNRINVLNDNYSNTMLSTYRNIDLLNIDFVTAINSKESEEK